MRGAWLVIAIAACGRAAPSTPVAPPVVAAPAAADARVAIAPAERLTFATVGDDGAAADVINRRLDALAIAGAARVEGIQVVVDLPALDPEVREHTKDMIMRVGRFAIVPVDDGDDAATEAMARIARHVADDPGAAPHGITADGLALLADDGRERFEVAEAIRLRCGGWGPGRAGGPSETRYVDCDRTGRQRIEAYLAALPAELRLPADHALGFEPTIGDDPLHGSVVRWRTRVLVRAPLADGRAIADARADATPDDPAVTITLRADAARRLGAYTATHTAPRLAFVVDDTIVAAPLLGDRFTGERVIVPIAGLTHVIPGDELADRRTAADDLAIVLRSGALPGRMTFLTDTTLTP